MIVYNRREARAPLPALLTGGANKGIPSTAIERGQWLLDSD